MCQAVTIVSDCERTILSPSFHSRKGSDQWRVSPFGMLKAEKAWAWQTPQTLCWEDCFSCWCCCVQASRNPVTTRNHVCRALTFCHAGKRNKFLPALLVDRTFVQQSSSYRPPVLNTHALHSFHFCKGSVRSRNSFSLAMLKTVESWESLSLADTSDLALGRLL